MNNRKAKLKLTDFEGNLLWGRMNEFRNRFASGKCRVCLLKVGCGIYNKAL